MSLGDTNKHIINTANKGVMIDIGANHGMYTTQMAKKATKVYAFEPHPDNLKKLEEACKGCDNIIINPTALSNKRGTCRLFLSKNNPGGHSISVRVADVGKWTHTIDNYIEVPTITLDDYCIEHDVTGITAIKVDVEGAEEYVLAGMYQTLRNNKLVMSLETHQTIDCQEVADILKRCGYKIWSKRRDCLVDIVEYDSQYYVTNRPEVLPES